MASVQTLMARLEKLEAGSLPSKEEPTVVIVKLVASNGNDGMRPEGNASNTVTCLGMDGELRLTERNRAATNQASKTALADGVAETELGGQTGNMRILEPFISPLS